MPLLGHSVVMSAADATDFCYGLPGTIPPAGDFDPANLLKDRSKAEVYKWRESELTHGRVSMLACAGFLAQEVSHPLGDNLPALAQLRQLPDPLLFTIPTVIGFCETARSQRWTRNEVIRNVLPKSDAGEYLGYYPGELGYYPGDVGFDPLGLKPKDPAELRVMQEKELAHGRLAMLAAAGFVAQEAATSTTWSAAWHIPSSL
uniref:Chlorophyll a-b binding protein, chloroplastic n=1 Tax=Prymnesium polylepis TaxID=72548 RepID=A0A7S4N9U8_9EUKA